MKHSMAIKMILRRYRLNRRHVADKLGEKEKFLFKSINDEGVKIDRMVAVLDALGYQLVFQPKGRDSLPERSYPIRWSDYQAEE